jgi:hypothetical protein
MDARIAESQAPIFVSRLNAEARIAHAPGDYSGPHV